MTCDTEQLIGRELNDAVAALVMGLWRHRGYWYAGDRQSIETWQRFDRFEPSTEIESAWRVHKHCCGWIYSKRRRYLAALRQCISERVLRNPDRDLIAVEEVAHLMEPIDICRAGLRVTTEGAG